MKQHIVWKLKEEYPEQYVTHDNKLNWANAFMKLKPIQTQLIKLRDVVDRCLNLELRQNHQ